MRVMSRQVALAASSPQPIGWPSPEVPGRGGVGWPGDHPAAEPGQDDGAGNEPAVPQGARAA
jgi:hypothetical protein